MSDLVDTDGPVMREVRRMPGDPFRPGDGDPNPNPPGQRQRRGIRNNGIPSETPEWTILWANGETDSRDYKPSAFEGDVGCGVILYHAEEQTHALWGYSWYAYFPEETEDHPAETWRAMDPDDLAAIQARGDRMEGLFRGLLVADEVYDRIWYRVLTHDYYHEIRAGFDPGDFVVWPAARQILRDIPNFSERFAKDHADRWEALSALGSPYRGAARNDGVSEGPAL